MHHQALVDGPSKTPNMAVPRHATALGNVILTHIVMPKLPRAAGRGAVARAWEKDEVEQKWEESAWAKRRAVREKRRNLTDFDRFRVLKLNKQVSEDAHGNTWSGLAMTAAFEASPSKTMKSVQLFMCRHMLTRSFLETFRGPQSIGKGSIISEGIMRDRGLVDSAVVQGLLTQRALRFRGYLWATGTYSNSNHHPERLQRAVIRVKLTDC